MNQFSAWESLELTGLSLLCAWVMAFSLIAIVGSIVIANISYEGWTGFNTFFLVLGIVGLVIIPLGLGYLSYTSINTEYNEVLSADESKEYTALQVYKEFGVEKPDGVYVIDHSEMDTKLFSQIKKDEKNPYDFILQKIPDKEAIEK